jgi:teichuronic acid exporter
MSLRRAAASGVKWTAASFVITLGVRLVVLAVLGRWLAPEDFGLVTMIVALASIFQALGDFGLGSAIVGAREPDRDQLCSVFWLAQILGAISFALVVALEPVFVDFYGEPRLMGLVVWLALRFLVSPIAIPFQGLLQRDLEFRTLFAVQVFTGVVGAVVAIAGASLGFGIHALVWGELVAALGLSALALGVGWRRWHPRLRLRRADLGPYLGFGLNQTGERALNLFVMNVDNLLVGRVLGAATLGVYSIAFEIASLPTRMNFILTRVAFPIFVRRRDDDAALARGYLEMSRLIAITQFPVLVTIAVLADLFVPLLLGPKWLPAVPLVQVLALFGLIRALGNPSGVLFLAKGRTDLAMRLGVLFAIANAVVFWFVVPHGTLALSWAWSAMGGFHLVTLTAVLEKLVSLRPAAYLAALLRPAAIGGLTAGYLLAGRGLVGLLTPSQSAQLVCAALVAAVLVVPTAWRLERSFLSALIENLRGKTPA